MKAFKSLLVFGCMAALVACSKEEESGVILLKAGEHSITLSVDERPDTRVSYSHQEGESVYRFSWSAGDAIGVYVPGRVTAVKYTIDEIDGRKATFKLAEDYYIELGQQMVNIVYPFSEEDNFFVLPGPDSQNSFGLENMGQYTVLYAKDVPMTDGQFGDVKLKHATSYLHFPAGFEFFTGQFYAIKATEAKLEDVYNVFGFKDLMPSESESDNYIWIAQGHISVGVDDGKLVDDVYVPFFVPEGGLEMHLKWSMTLTPSENYYYDKATYSFTPPQKTMKPGMVYTATETSFPRKYLNFHDDHDNIFWED